MDSRLSSAVLQNSSSFLSSFSSKNVISAQFSIWSCLKLSGEGVSPFYEIPYYVDSSSFESSNYQHKYPNKKRMTYDVSIIILPMSKI